MKRSVVRPYACISRRSTAAAACGGFAAECRAGRTYRSTAAGVGAQQQRRRSTALSSTCGQCHVDNRGMRLSRDCVYFFFLFVACISVNAIAARRLYILCWREHSRRKLE